MTVGFDLETPRLRLERLSDHHLEDLVALDADPRVMRFINGGQPTSRREYEDAIMGRIKAWDDKPFGFAAAYHFERFIGWFHLRPTVASYPAALGLVLELGYRLRHEAWGRGLATEGGRALVHYAFHRLGVACVDGCAHPDNVASRRVLEKCGMNHVGQFEHPRAPLEVVHYEVRRDAPRRSDADVGSSRSTST
ncbi:MAG: GNAT family N-acetyltransferase [Myxococcota bacterium]